MTRTLKISTRTSSKTDTVPLRSQSPAPAAGKSKLGDSIFQRIHTPKKDTMLSCRYELKYRIHETKARAIAQYVSAYIPVDHYSQKSPNLEYLISSLYFDSSNFHLAKETMEKKNNRFKLRIRCYDDEPDTPCFVEIKRRLNTVILKDRARLSKDDLGRVVENMYIPESLYKKDKNTLRQFQFYLRVLNARPIHLVRYKRQAYEGCSNNRVRITFDRELCFKTVNRPILTVNGSDWHRTPMGFVVLEIKFTERYPLWLSDMVKMFDLKQTSMSKYVSTVKQSCSMGFCAPIS